MFLLQYLSNLGGDINIFIFFIFFTYYFKGVIKFFSIYLQCTPTIKGGAFKKKTIFFLILI